MQIQILVSGLPVEGAAYRAGEGVIIFIPDIAQKVGEWDGKAYEFEGGVELVQGPDGKVWAQVCEFADIPSSEPPAGTVVCPICRDSSVTREEDDATGKVFTGRCSLCWGTGVIPSWELSQEGDIVYALGYWHCECKTDLIHPDNHNRCPVCGAVADNQTTSRADKVQEYLAALGQVVEL
jgi:uncharacterized Zn finger protein (UPF0148 family)